MHERKGKVRARKEPFEGGWHVRESMGEIVCKAVTTKANRNGNGEIMGISSRLYHAVGRTKRADVGIMRQ